MIFLALSKTTSILASLRGREDSNSIGIIIWDISGVGGSSFSESVFRGVHRFLFKENISFTQFFYHLSCHLL